VSPFWGTFGRRGVTKKGLAMPSKLRCHLTYANVVSTVCLFVVLSGSAYAAVTLSKNSVRSRHIKNGQVKRADIADFAVTSAKVADSSLLAQDFKTGQLPAGPKGDPGATSVTARIATGSGTVTANCQPGERATGGGAHSAEGIVVGQGPVWTGLTFYAPPSGPGSPYTPTAWSAAAETPTVPADVTAYVVCAAP
jgi:hypothetical protein